MTRGRSPHRHRAGTDIALRAAGALLLGLAALAAYRLLGLAHADPAFRSHAQAYGLAAIAFLSGSAGLGLLTHGAHIFDRIEIGRLWAPSDGRLTSSPPAARTDSDR